MSVNGVDYSKTMAKEREYFRDSARKLQNSTDERIKNNDEITERKLKQQRENFIRDKMDMEKTYQNNLSDIKEETQETQKERNEKFTKELLDERQKFAKESTESRKDFNDRLEHIRSNYKKSFDAEKKNHHNLNEISTEKYEKNVDNLQKNFQNKIEDYVQNVNDIEEKRLAVNKDERTQLVRSHSDNMIKSQNDANENLNSVKKRNSLETKKLIDTHNNESVEQKAYTQDRLKNIQNKMNAKVDGLSTDYRERNEKIVEEQQKRDLRTNLKQNEDIAKIKNEHGFELRQLDLEKRRQNDNTSGSFLEFQKRQQGIKNQAKLDKKIQDIRDDYLENQRRYIRKSNSDQNAFNQDLKLQSREASAFTRRKLDAAEFDKLMTVEHEREQADNTVHNVQNQRKLDRLAYESGINTEKSNAKNQITRLTETFNTTVKTLEDKHLADLQELSRISSNDKNEFIKAMQKRRSEEIYDMKRAFNNVMDATVQDYEQRLSSYHRENEQLKISMDQKIHKMLDTTQKELHTQKTMFDERRDADLKSQKMMMDEREHLLRKNMNELIANYQKKIDKMQFENDTEMKLMSKDYDNRFTNLKEFTRKELETKDNLTRLEINRLKEANENELNRVVNMYEAQIESIKNAHKEQINNITENKRIS
jgi:hypothetical protein